MKTPQSSFPSYLARNPHSYCFRMVVPQDLQVYLDRKGLRYSLCTGYIGTANHKARYFASQVQMLVKCLEGGKAAMKALTADKIQELVARHIKESIDARDRTFYQTEEGVVGPFSTTILYGHTSGILITFKRT